MCEANTVDHGGWFDVISFNRLIIYMFWFLVSLLTSLDGFLMAPSSYYQDAEGLIIGPNVRCVSTRGMWPREQAGCGQSLLVDSCVFEDVVRAVVKMKGGKRYLFIVLGWVVPWGARLRVPPQSIPLVVCLHVAETQSHVCLTWNKAYSFANQWVDTMN